MVREKYAVLASGGPSRFPKLLAGFENPSGRIWFWPLIVWLVVPDRYCDRDRSTRRRFAGYGIPTPASECLEGNVGLADRDVRFRQPVVDLPINREPVCAGEGLDLHVSLTPALAAFARQRRPITRREHIALPTSATRECRAMNRAIPRTRLPRATKMEET
jgi:hypothetical protein